MLSPTPAAPMMRDDDMRPVMPPPRLAPGAAAAPIPQVAADRAPRRRRVAPLPRAQPRPPSRRRAASAHRSAAPADLARRRCRRSNMPRPPGAIGSQAAAPQPKRR